MSKRTHQLAFRLATIPMCSKAILLIRYSISSIRDGVYSGAVVSMNSWCTPA